MEVSEIIQSIDIPEYISQYIELEEKGGELWGLSPFKAERTPSFSLDPETGYWYDFSSGFGGNLIDFVIRHDDVGVREAVGILKKYANIVESEKNGNVKMEASRIAKRYRYHQKKTPVCTAKILSDDYMERFEFRRDKLKIWNDEGIPYDVMYKYGIRYDALDDRIVYPIRNYDGDIVSVCGRTCDPDYKEHGLRKYTYLQSIGTVDTIYGYYEHSRDIKEKKEFILFEGCKSVLKADAWGIKNTGAILTSHLSDNQFRFLLKLSNYYSVRIVFALDSDVDIMKDDNIKRLLSYARVDWVKNRNNMLQEKDSPVDAGEGIWQQLYYTREALN